MRTASVSTRTHSCVVLLVATSCHHLSSRNESTKQMSTDQMFKDHRHAEIRCLVRLCAVPCFVTCNRMPVNPLCACIGCSSLARSAGRQCIHQLFMSYPHTTPASCSGATPGTQQSSANNRVQACQTNAHVVAPLTGHSLHYSLTKPTPPLNSPLPWHRSMMRLL
jgi:hypothetical protein